MAGRGGILRVDLSSGRISAEPIPAELRRRYLGGEGIRGKRSIIGPDPCQRGSNPL